MFCPKCGGSNPDNGKFCRSCGQDLSPVSLALQSNGPQSQLACGTGTGSSIEGAMSRLFMGVAFLIIAAILGITGMGRSWWFWLLIPGFLMIGTGVARYMILGRNERVKLGPSDVSANTIAGARVNALPDMKADFANPASVYRTGDLVPPSVTDSTTRHLEVDSEGQTMTLPQK